MSWATNQPVLLSPWGQSVAAAGHSSAFTNAMRGWGGTSAAQTTATESLHHTSRNAANYAMPYTEQK